MAGHPDFRRVILSMGPGAIDRQALKMVADLAHLLELEMVGVFIEDESVLRLAGLPFVRELRLPGHAWHRLDPARVSEELRAAARQARKLLNEEGTARGMPCRFEIRRGDPASLARELGEITDIVAVCEPAEAAGWLSAAVSRARQSALTSSASVLFLPSTDIAHTGPIAVVARTRSSPAMSLAARIAKAAGEELVFASAKERSAGGLAASLGRALGSRRERLTIMSRATAQSDEAVVNLVSKRAAPVLVIDGAEAAAGEKPAN